MNEGFIKLHRRIRKWQWYKKPDTYLLFNEIMLTANHKDKMVGVDMVKRGQLMTSHESLRKYTGLSIKKTRTSLNRLKASGEITCKTTNKHTIITVCNYEDYNDRDLIEGQAKGQATGQAEGKQRATTKNEKKYTDDSWEIQGANKIFDKMLSYNNKLKEPNYQEWAYHLDLLRRVDKHTEEEIFQVVKWLWTSDDNNAEFWRKNILSTKTLRKQFARLFPLSKPPKKPNYGF